jgi:hypothetical protein
MTTAKVTLSVFAAGAVRLFDESGKLKKATNEVIESWTPIVRAAMEAGRRDVQTRRTRPTRRRCGSSFFKLFVDFFKSCPKAMEMLRTMASA